MSFRTCAACDCELDGEAINVTVGGKTVEVCCEDCAKALNEAFAPSSRLATPASYVDRLQATEN